MLLSHVVAVATNGVIGRNNQLPWHIPEDLKFFKRVTMGKPMIMGRKTFESIGRALPGRTSIVITYQEDYSAEGIEVVNSLEAAIDLARTIAEYDGQEEATIIGGAQVFREAMPRTERLYLTEVHAEVEGDTFYPDFDREQWQEVFREDHFAASDNPYDYSFLILERKV